MTKDTGGQACQWCNEGAVRKQGRIWLCPKHYRFQQMRVNAKRYWKEVPLYWELENMLSWTEGMVCQPCKRPMNWLSEEGQSTVVTLQHDRSGTMRLICRACNSCHHHYEGDTFYDKPEGTKLCKSCNRILPELDFCKDNSKASKLKSYCRECTKEKHYEWRRKRSEFAC
ncbi:MAG: hypothetical protein ACUZ8H_02715 [Candidatus Anammoxibacter sp.]